MRIEARCARCGVIASGEHWSPVATAASIHRVPVLSPSESVKSDCVGSVQVMAVLSASEWNAQHPDHKLNQMPGPAGMEKRRGILHLDSDGSTILVPAVVEGI